MHAEMKDTPDAPKSAKKELEKLGPLSLDEKITSGAFAVTVGLWIFGASVGINAVAAALLGLTILLVTNVVKWKDCLGEVLAITATPLKLHLLRVTHASGCMLTALKEQCFCQLLLVKRAWKTSRTLPMSSAVQLSSGKTHA